MAPNDDKEGSFVIEAKVSASYLYMTDITETRGISPIDPAEGARDSETPGNPGGDDDAEAPTVPDAEDMGVAGLDADDE